MGCDKPNREAVMNPSRGLFAVGLALVAAAGCGGTKTVTVTVPGPTKTVTDTAPAKARGLGAPRQVLEFGYIKSLTPAGAHYMMRFDPAWFLTGITANTAAAEDGAVEPGQPVPNDNYVLDEGHRLLTYLIPAGARVTVLTNQADAGITATPVTVAQLAEIVNGQSPLKLFEPIATGFWITVSVDTVRSLDQQYRA